MEDKSTLVIYCFKQLITSQICARKYEKLTLARITFMNPEQYNLRIKMVQVECVKK